MKTDQADHPLLLTAIEEQGTLAGAADALGLTAPAVSQRLARAERFWGARLVERGPRGASLTDTGTALAATAAGSSARSTTRLRPSPPTAKA